jgi:hypothetical protein
MIVYFLKNIKKKLLFIDVLLHFENNKLNLKRNTFSKKILQFYGMIFNQYKRGNLAKKLSAY